ncbi:MAG: hypothetical protein QXS85_01955 [Acidilobaceae archaeon]
MRAHRLIHKKNAPRERTVKTALKTLSPVSRLCRDSFTKCDNSTIPAHPTSTARPGGRVARSMERGRRGGRRRSTLAPIESRKRKALNHARRQAETERLADPATAVALVLAAMAVAIAVYRVARARRSRASQP